MKRASLVFAQIWSACAVLLSSQGIAIASDASAQSLPIERVATIDGRWRIERINGAIAQFGAESTAPPESGCAGKLDTLVYDVPSAREISTSINCIAPRTGVWISVFCKSNEIEVNGDFCAFRADARIELREVRESGTRTLFSMPVPTNQFFRAVVADEKTHWIVLANAFNLPTRSTLHRIDVSAGAIAKTLTIGGHFLSGTLRGSELGLIVSDARSTTKDSIFFERYDAEGTRVQRETLSRLIDEKTPTPLSWAHFIPGPKSLNAPWVINRRFLKWGDVVNVTPQGVQRIANQNIDFAESTLVRETQSDGSTRERLLQWTRGSFQYFADPPSVALIRVDDQFEIQVGDAVYAGGSATFALALDETRTYLYFTATRRKNALAPIGINTAPIINTCNDIGCPGYEFPLRTDLFRVPIDALLKAAPVTKFGAPFGENDANFSPNDLNAFSKPVIEYYNATLDHFFVTIDPAEQRAIEGGLLGANWHRIGFAMWGWNVNDPRPSDALPVCRFYGRLGVGPNSHFFTASEHECEKVQQDRGWQLEATRAFYVSARDVHAQRLYNNRAAANDSNHRWTSRTPSYVHHCIFGWTFETNGFNYCANASYWP